MNIKKITLATLCTLLLVSCGGSETKDSKASTIEGLKTLQNSSKVEQIADNININEEAEAFSCDSGTYNILESMPPQYQFNKCQKDAVYIDGTITPVLGFNGNNSDFELSFTADTTFEDVEIKKGSRIVYDFDEMLQDANFGILEVDFKMLLNAVTLNVNNLKVEIFSASCGMFPIVADCMETTSFDFISGSLVLGKNSFSLDTSYEKNSIVLTEMGLESGGVIHLLDGANHKVEVAVVESGFNMNDNYLTIKIDENGDGVFSADEMLNFEEENQHVCTQEYAPVCASVNVKCITEPCEPVNQTFSNRCTMDDNGNATFLYEGECK